MKTTILFLLFFLVSCAGYVDQVHRSLDKEEKMATRRKDPNRFRDEFHQYGRRLRPEQDKRPVQNPLTYTSGTPGGQAVRPPVKRDYRPQRYQASDFVDEDSSGSLWTNQGSSSSLFTYQNDKHTGDMVIINVLEDLRNQISSELKRSFPDKPKKAAAKTDDKKAGANPQAAPPATPNKEEHDMDMKVYDKISGTVVEEVSKDYIVLKGRKDVIFKKEKRSIEVQALVSRKDILENDYVNSDKLLESKVYVLRPSYE
ncbi:MAG: flagellar basal body L-ring protein FlgH [Bacteriovoracaceae bacterium]